MKIALFDNHRLGLVTEDEGSVVDATGVLPAHDDDLGANFWVRLCRDIESTKPRLRELLATGERQPLDSVSLLAPVLNPTKIIAAASNYSEHVAEMRSKPLSDWMFNFDVFLKSPSSLTGPGATVTLPEIEAEIHYECELAFVIGTEGRHIRESEALSHVMGWTILFDITERGQGDRSRRKSYDGFTPVGPWVVTADEVPDWRDLEIELRLNGVVRQHIRAGEMLVSVPQMIAYASKVMTLMPGDIITTGAPPGVGKIQVGDELVGTITGLGTLSVDIA